VLFGSVPIQPNLGAGWEVGGVAVTATAAELNILDGVTASTAELNILDGVTASTAELNILDGVTASAAELNILDGVTASTAELNILDGVTATASELNVLDGIAGIASQAEAEAGTDNTKLMTPLRTAEAVAALGGGTVLLGTIVTTSGSTQTLSGLDLTPYKSVVAVFDGVGDNTATSRDVLFEGARVASTGTTAADRCYGIVRLDLSSGVGVAHVTEETPTSLPQSIYEDAFRILRLSTSTSSTSLSVSLSGGTFAAGSVLIYGEK
jgi:hypothetical protein